MGDIVEFIHDLLDIKSGNLFFHTDDDTVNVSELRKNAKRTAALLKSYKLQPGDRVLIMLENSIELIQLIFGTSMAGGSVVVVNPDTLTENVEYIINDCKPKYIISSFVDKFNYYNKGIKIISLMEYKQDIQFYSQGINLNFCHKYITRSKNDEALLIYTSGSTGKPKAVISSHKQVIFCTKAISKELDMGNSDVIGCLLPLSFDYGLYQVFLALISGADICLGNTKDAGIQLYNFLNKWKITVFPSMPHLTNGLIRILEKRKGTLSIKKITNTGESLPSSLIEKIRRLIPDSQIYLMYGLTECKRVSILNPKDISTKISSVGKPLEGTHCFIVNENNELLPSGEIGELVVVGPNVMEGYLNQSELTKMRFRHNLPFTKDRALFTGDYFHMDGDGYLYFHGRRDDQFKQSGYRLSSIEIEEAVNKIPYVERGILITPNKKIKKSILYAKTNKDISYVNEQLKMKLERYKLPQIIVVVKEFPLNINGKVDKNKLIESYLGDETNEIL
ncbi:MULTISPECIES: class I adenylate-forming enzyme family protein [unclassified Bacillus (in: firmicutes)]|uniref:class I adenylate-forming enzyme family protein n=1 Tax=unclassified Bacillus (in: firmicutes) TaxID=185979 RepID=UPI00300FD8DA